MESHHEDIAVACYVSGRLLGFRYFDTCKIIVVGTLVHAQCPFETDEGEQAEGWPDHFHSLNAYSEHDKKIYPLHITDDRTYKACEHAAISTLRYNGHLFDEDEEILSQYG